MFKHVVGPEWAEVVICYSVWSQRRLAHAFMAVRELHINMPGTQTHWTHQKHAVFSTKSRATHLSFQRVDVSWGGGWSRSFKYMKMDRPEPGATQRGGWTNRPLKCGNLQYKWMVLIWWAEWCTLAERTYCEILFATLCSVCNPPSSLHRSSTLSPPLVYLLPFVSLLPLSESRSVSFLSARFSAAQVFRAWNETGSVAAGGCR